MTYKDTLFFVARSLTIAHELENFDFVKTAVENNQVDWEKVVLLSTKHYVFPALFCNYKKKKILEFLPQDLVAYMEHITELNRARNRQILSQAGALNQILSDAGIQGVFIKGTGFLLQDFYDDIGERMVGDIDLLVAPESYVNVIQLLKDKGYYEQHQKDYSFPFFRHYDRLVKDGNIAAVEVHKALTTEKHHAHFNWQTVFEKTISIDSFRVLDMKDQIVLTTVAKQINDAGQYQKDISLRNAYDVFKLSVNIDSLSAIRKHIGIFSILNNFLCVCSYTLNSQKITYQNNSDANAYLDFYINKIGDPSFGLKHQKQTQKKLALQNRFNFLIASLHRKENRQWILRRFFDKDWQRAKLIQLGLIKPKQ